jgi:hypothetical protein
MGVGSHDRAATEAGDGGGNAGIVGGDDHGIGAARQLRLLDDMLDEKFSGLAGQRLAGKSGGTVAGGYHNDHAHVRGS